MPTYFNSSESSAGSSTSSSPPPSPTKSRAKARSLRLHSIGEDPAVLVGKTLTFVRRSAAHPNITMGFSDGTTFRLLVDGYDPVHRGVPKELEMDESLRGVFDPEGGHVALNLPLLDCTFTRLTDKAFKVDSREGESRALQRWDQSHLALALKFAEDDTWRCIWATLLEREGSVENEGLRGASGNLGLGSVVTFRSYDDVYLERVVKPPPSPRNRRRTRGSVEITRTVS